MNKRIVSIIGMLLLCACSNMVNNPSTSSTSSATTSAVASSKSSSVAVQTRFPYPLPNGASRITKKPFGIYITPKTSPVQPERFTGYHTGTDFETFPDEQNIDVPVQSICDGTVLYRGWVSGYGGVMIQSCAYQGNAVTILYGHLNVDSIAFQKGNAVKTGDTIGKLGKGYSQETDGERKHLHLSVHKGSAINFKGYAQTASELGGWMNAYP